MAQESKQVCIGSGHDDDAHYRYKRDRAQVTFTSKHGTTTHFVNVAVITRQLQCEASSLLQFVQKRLSLPKILYAGSSSSGYLGKAKAVKQTHHRRSTAAYEVHMHGRVTVDQLEAAIRAFEDNVVLCKQCKLPEKDGHTGQCRACGRRASSAKKPIKSALRKSRASGTSSLSSSSRSSSSSSSSSATNTPTEADKARNSTTTSTADTSKNQDQTVEHETEKWIQRLYDKRNAATTTAAEKKECDQYIERCWDCSTSSEWCGQLQPQLVQRYGQF